MARSARTPAHWVRLTQAMVAQEMVEECGLPERRAAERLGLTPSAVSQYLSGKRLPASQRLPAPDEWVRRRIRQAALTLIASPVSRRDSSRYILETALDLLRHSDPSRSFLPPGSVSPPGLLATRAFRRNLRARVAGEQAAVAACMRLAQRSRDELTRAIFRQIASDSLRHAEIAASLETYLDRGFGTPVATGITAKDVDRLIAREHAAEASTDANLREGLGGLMGLLWESMEADERKHDQLLKELRHHLLFQTSGESGAGHGATPARRPGLREQAPLEGPRGNPGRPMGT